MTVQNALYKLEHIILPDLFFTSCSDFTMQLLSDSEYIYRIFSALTVTEGLFNPYLPGSFATEVHTPRYGLCSDLTVITLTPPAPSEETLCMQIHFFFDSKFKKCSIFCTEKCLVCPEYYLCGWTADGSHINYGACDDVSSSLQTAFSFYLNEYYDYPLPPANYV